MNGARPSAYRVANPATRYGNSQCYALCIGIGTATAFELKQQEEVFTIVGANIADVAPDDVEIVGDLRQFEPARIHDGRIAGDQVASGSSRIEISADGFQPCGPRVKSMSRPLLRNHRPEFCQMLQAVSFQRPSSCLVQGGQDSSRVKQLPLWLLSTRILGGKV